MLGGGLRSRRAFLVKHFINFSSAPVDGHWGRWSNWGKCDKACGFGTHSRIRQCQDPPPTNGGKDCHGEKIQSGRCKLKSCGLGKLYFS